ncbi:MAG: hypothetical protein ACYC1D_03255 [Acidimicrobiales bacterium]
MGHFTAVPALRCGHAPFQALDDYLQICDSLKRYLDAGTAFDLGFPPVAAGLRFLARRVRASSAFFSLVGTGLRSRDPPLSIGQGTLQLAKSFQRGVGPSQRSPIRQSCTVGRLTLSVRAVPTLLRHHWAPVNW